MQLNINNDVHSIRPHIAPYNLIGSNETNNVNICSADDTIAIYEQQFLTPTATLIT